MEKLSKELLHLIFARLKWKDLGRIAGVCKAWNALSKDNYLFTTLSLIENIAEFNALRDFHIDWLLPRVAHVTHFAIFGGRSSNDRGFSPSKEFLTKPVEGEEPERKDDEKEDWTARHKRETKMTQHREAVFANLASGMKSLQFADLRGVSSGIQEKMLELLQTVHNTEKKNEVLTDLKILRFYDAKVYPGCLLSFPKLTSLTIGYAGFPQSNVGEDPLPTEIAQLVNLRTLSMYHPIKQDFVDLSNLSKLTEVSLLIAKVDKPTKFPVGVTHVTILSRLAQNFIFSPADHVQHVTFYGTARVEFNNKFETPYKQMPPEWKQFKSLKSLKFVKIGLQVQSLDGQHLVSSSPDLQNLDFSLNYISEIPFLTQWKHLVEVGMSKKGKRDLSFNELTSLPANLNELKFLRKLQLRLNSLTSLPSFLGMTSLTYLDLSENQFTEFPTAILDATSLTHLYLEEMSFETFPSDLCLNLTKLEHLQMMGCMMSSIPEEIGNLQELRILNLSYNKLISLPSSIFKLKKLLLLDLTFNKLDYVPLLLPVCFTVATGEFLSAVLSYFSGKWPLDYDLHPRIQQLCLPNKPPQLKPCKEYKGTPEQREGAWFFLNPERRDYVGIPNDKNEDKGGPLGKNSVWFTMVTEALYRYYWTIKATQYKRYNSFEQAWAWSRPSVKRDRISQCEFSGHANLAGVVVTGVTQTEGELRFHITSEYRVGGTAVRDQSWNARGHWQGYSFDVTVDAKTFIAVETKQGSSTESYREPK